MTDELLFKAEYLPEADEQLVELALEYREKIVEAISTFEQVGTAYKNINDLGNGLFEIKPKGVRAYFMYDYNRRRIIIIGFICLKTTQKAPERYMKQARKLIEAYLEKEAKELAHEKT
jgi:phage-related protein